MNSADLTIRNPLLSIIVILLVIAGGWTAYQSMPRFEDPEFTIRSAIIITQYPGATPLEVANEVTEPLERTLQRLQEVEDVESKSVPGRSEITVNIKYEFSPTKADLQLIWTKVRNQINDATASLPPGAGTPLVNDDFGDVYGLYYFLTGDGFSPSELHRYAKNLQNELLLVDGVAKVALEGDLKEAIFVEISQQNVASLGVSQNNIYATLEKQNTVVSSGEVDIGKQRLAIRPSGSIDSVEAIDNLLIDTTNDGRLIYLKDVAHVWRGYQTPPAKLFRFNGKPAIAIGISGVLGSNIVEISNAVGAKLNQAENQRPLGMELHQFYHQGEEVQAAVDNFVVNVIAALLIVIVTLFFFMGARSAVVIGAGLLLTIAATLATMDIIGIPMHRISLGALIIALGMMVDNAIVVTEGILVGTSRGLKKLDIARQIIDRTKWPLLGGTLVGIIAFAPIGLAPGETAEYTGDLFWVILISLLFSWLFAITLTPLFCYWLFPDSSGAENSEPTEGALLTGFRSLLSASLARRSLVIAVTVSLFALSVWGFQFVKSGFFPASTSPQMVVDYWLPQGTRFDETQRDIIEIADHLSQMEGVEIVTTSIGGGGLRYMLVYGPEQTNSAYAQLLVRLDDYNRLDSLIPAVQQHIDQNYPAAQSKVWRFVLGPGGGPGIEAAFSGPDPAVLRKLADDAKAIMADDGRAISIKDDWRQQISRIEPIYSHSKGQRAGVSRSDLAAAIANNFSGNTVGVYREGDDLIPIISRAPLDERVDATEIQNIQVVSPVTGQTVPIGQVVDGFRTVWDNGSMKRENRIWTIKAQTDPLPGDNTSDLLNRIRPAIEAIELPPGYSLSWGGEAGDSAESNEDLASTLPLGLLAMVLTVVVLFNAIRQPLVIWLTVPLALIGVVIGLVATGTPLEFMAILGLLSLSGLLIKNAIVLVDQIDVELAAGKAGLTAILDAATSRVRPVMMGTLTTVLGVLPLMFDAFFMSMAVVIVFGLTFATLLTLIVVPMLYAVFFNISSSKT